MIRVVRNFLLYLLAFSLVFNNLPLLYAIDFGFRSQRKEYIQLGKDFLRKGELLKAKAMFELVLKEDPRNRAARAYVKRIEALLASKQLRENKVDVGALYNRAKQAFLAEDYDKAIELFSEILQYDPEHQYAQKYLEKAYELRYAPALDKAENSGVIIGQTSAETGLDSEDMDLLRTKLQFALTSLQQELLDYFGFLAAIKSQQDALLEKYLKEKESQIKSLESTVKDQRLLVNELSSQRLRLQNELARLSEEISLLEERLLAQLSQVSSEEGRDLSSILEELDNKAQNLTEEEKQLRKRLKEEILLRKSLEQQLKEIEAKLKQEKFQEKKQSKDLQKEVVELTQQLIEIKKKKAVGRKDKNQEKTGKARQTDSRKLRSLLQKGKKEFSRGRYQRAIDILQEVVRLDGIEGRYALQAKRIIDKAREILQKRARQRIARQKRDLSSLNLFYKAQDEYYKGNYGRAISICEEILKNQPDFLPAKNLISLIKAVEEYSNRAKEKQKELKVSLPKFPKLSFNEEQSKQDYIQKNLKRASDLVESGKFGDAISVLERVLRVYPSERVVEDYLREVKKLKEGADFKKAVENIKDLIDNKEYILAEREVNKLIRIYPKKRKQLVGLKQDLEVFLVKPYLESVDELLRKGDRQSLKKALRIIKRARSRYPKNQEIKSYYRKVIEALRELKDKTADKSEKVKKIKIRSVKAASLDKSRQNTLRALERAVRQKAKLFSGDNRILDKVHRVQDEYRKQYYETICATAEDHLKLGNYKKAKELLALIDENAPTVYQERAKKLLKDIMQNEKMRQFYKHIEMAKSAIKIYDFDTARKEIENAKKIFPSHKSLKKVIDQLEERIKFYKVQQALKVAQMHLENSDFVGAKIVVKDILKNIDPNNKYAKEMLKQIEKAEDMYYADLKLREGIRALRAGDYEGAVLLAKEGLKLNSRNRDLWDLYRRARARWRTEILRRKSLIHQIEQEAAEKRRVSMALREVKHKRLVFANREQLVTADVKGLLDQAKRLLREQKYDRAIALCKKVLEYEPDNPEAKALLDLILLTQEEISKKKLLDTKKQSKQSTTSKNEVFSMRKKRISISKLAKGDRDSPHLKGVKKLVSIPPLSESKPFREKQVQIQTPSNFKREKLLALVDKEALRHGQKFSNIEKLNSELARERDRLFNKQRLAIERLNSLHLYTLKQLDKEVFERAKLYSKQKQWLEARLDRFLEKKAKQQLQSQLADLRKKAKDALRKKQFSLALDVVKSMIELNPSDRYAMRLKHRILKEQAAELDKLAREKRERECRYARAREKMFREMGQEILRRANQWSSSMKKLDNALDRERELLAQAQEEEILDSQLRKLAKLINVFSKDPSVSREVKGLIKEIGKRGDYLSASQERLFAKLNSRYEQILNALEKEKELKKQQIRKQFEKLRIVQANTGSDAVDKKQLIKDMLQQAKEYLYNGSYSDVLRLTEKILAIDENNKTALDLAERARTLLKKEAKLKSKQVKLEKEKYPAIREIYEQAKELYNKGDYLKAKDLFAKVYKYEKNLGISYYTPYALQYLDLIKERQKDIQLLNKEKETEELKERIVEKLYKDAEKFEKQGKYSMACSVYENILFLFPNDKKARQKLFAVKEKIFAKEKEKLEHKLEEQDKEMLKEVMEEGLVDVRLKEKKVSRKDRKRHRILNLPPIKKKLQQKISANFEDVPLVDVLKFFAKQTGINIIPSASVLSGKYNVTINVKDMPLESALKYLLKSYNLTYQIDDDAVWITTPDQLEKEPVETKIYHLNKGVGLYTKFSQSTSGSVELGSGASVSEVKTLKDILKEAVDWPSGSKLVLDERTGTLIVTNTPANIKKIDEILWNLDITPVQVLIEAKFIEVDVTDLQEIGVEWKIANEDWATDVKDGQFAQGVAKDSGVDFSDFSRMSEGLNLTYKGVLTKPQFEAVLHALEESKNTRTLSSPRVTTLNNQTAVIKVVDEWIYPTRYEFQIVQYDLNGDGDYDDAGETRYENVPTDFVKRDVGIILNVTPSVGDDMKTISLSLIPEVSDAVADYFQYTGGVSLPKFTSRNLSTNVVVENTDTVVLGGLIKETRNKVLTKVPVLGDIPILGQLFKKKADTVNRRNLLIFVTATIIDPEGDALVSTD